jgi:FkbM family methyltransferase
MLCSIAQLVRNRYLSAARGGAVARQAGRVWFKLEQVLAKLGDPIVTHDVAGRPIRLPISHMLPRILVTCPQYNLNLGRLGAAVAGKYPTMSAIDVGANVGDSVAILRAGAQFPILCVEADPRYFGLLQTNVTQFPDVTVVRAYLGERDEEVAARLEAKEGTAKLAPAPADAADGAGTLGVRRLSTVLRDQPRFERAKLLKVDTDGYDNKILRGAADFLASARPVVFFEYDPHFLSLQGDDGVSIFPMLRSLGYRGMLVYDNVGPFVRGVSLDDSAAVEEVHRWAAREPGVHYADLCLFHAEDSDLHESLRGGRPGARRRRTTSASSRSRATSPPRSGSSARSRSRSGTPRRRRRSSSRSARSRPATGSAGRSARGSPRSGSRTRRGRGG